MMISLHNLGEGPHDPVAVNSLINRTHSSCVSATECQVFYQVYILVLIQFWEVRVTLYFPHLNGCRL